MSNKARRGIEVGRESDFFSVGNEALLLYCYMRVDIKGDGFRVAMAVFCTLAMGTRLGYTGC